MWDRREDAEMRLKGCVVMYNNRPVIIQEISVSRDGRIKAHYIVLHTGDAGAATLDNPLWNFKPFRTGYVNYRDKAYFVERTPVRKWKQGLHPDNIHLTPELPGGVALGLIRSPEFAASLNRDYPPLNACLVMLETKAVTSVAFSPLFCLSTPEIGPPFLEYMGTQVGWVEARQLKLGDEFHFLKESLAESLEAA